MSDRIYLRALEIEDSILINKWRRDPQTVKYLAGNFFFVSLEREKKSIESKILDDSKHIYLGICLIENDKLIGYTSINNIDLRNSKAEWGSIIIGERDLIGQGLGEEAAKVILRFLFDQYPVNKCYGYCLAEHPVTSKLLIKLGFKQDGLLRQEVYKNGDFKDIMIFSILRNEIGDHF